MDTHDLCSWSHAIEKLGGDQLLGIIGHELFTQAVDEAIDILEDLVQQDLVQFDESQNTTISDDETMGQAIARAMVEMDPDLDQDDFNFCTMVIASIFETSRHPLRWRDLELQERTLLEAAHLDFLRRNPEQLITANTDVLPDQDSDLTLVMRFVVWYGRNKGVMPEWFNKTINDLAIELRIEEELAQTDLPPKPAGCN